MFVCYLRAWRRSREWEKWCPRGLGAADSLGTPSGRVQFLERERNIWRHTCLYFLDDILRFFDISQKILKICQTKIFTRIHISISHFSFYWHHTKDIIAPYPARPTVLYNTRLINTLLTLNYLKLGVIFDVLEMFLKVLKWNSQALWR